MFFDSSFVSELVFFSVSPIFSLSLTRDPKKFFEHAKKYVEYLKKQIVPSATTTIAANDPNNAFRTQIAELCKDIVSERQLQLNLDDERYYRLLAIEILGPMRTMAKPLMEFVRSKSMILLQILRIVSSISVE